MRDIDEFINSLLSRIDKLEQRLSKLESAEFESFRSKVVDSDSDTTNTAGVVAKKITIQERTSAPTNAAYIAFTNNPVGVTFYIVMEDKS